MRDENSHFSDEQLLLTADGEPPPRRIEEVRKHLASCWLCRTRMAEIEATIADFVRATRSSEPELPPVSGPRALLKARLAELDGKTRTSSRWPILLGFNLRRLEYVSVVALVLVLGATIFFRLWVHNREVHDAGSEFAELLPNPSLTPGSTRQVNFGDICSSVHDQVVRSVPGDVRQRVFREYGVRDARPSDYEVDYLITPGLGGSDDIRNLWPEPRNSAVWNSFVKDQLEDHLHQLVCNGKVSLSAAQQEIAQNWISAYKKYFRTNRPLPEGRPKQSAGLWRDGE